MKSITRILASSAVAAAIALSHIGGAAAADSYKVDGSHTFVVFKVMHLGVASSYGMFRQIEGSFKVDEAKPEASSLDLTIDASSIFTADKKRDEHLNGPDFFDTKQFPKITLKSTKVEKSGDAWKVTADLTVKGRKKAVTFEMKKSGAGKDPWGNTRIGFEGQLTINRMDFGVDYMPDGLGRDVTLMLSVEGIKQ